MTDSPWDLLADGLLDEAAAGFAAWVQSSPDSPEPFWGLGQVLARAGEMDGALQAHTRVLQLQPAFPGAVSELAANLRSRGQFLRVHRLLDSLPPASKLTEEWTGVRAELALECGDHHGALRLLGSAPASHALRSLRLRAMLYDPAVSLFDLHAAVSEWSAGLPRPNLPPLSPPSADGTVRVALLNTRFHAHNSTQHLLGWLPHRDPRVKIHLLHAPARSEDIPADLLSLVDGHQTFPPNTTPVDFARAVRAGRHDILVDLNEHANGGRLAWLAPGLAPVQLHLYSNAMPTGLPAMHGRVTDRLLDESLARSHPNLEAVFPLDCGYHSYTPPPGAMERNPNPGSVDRPFTFGGMHHLAKYTPDVLRLWARLLATAPNARLLLVRDVFADPEVREQFGKRCLDAGLPPGRVQLSPDRPPVLSLLTDIDAILDTFPFCGDATTGDALWMGLPVVTLRGPGPRGGRSAAQLLHAGLGETIADTPAAYLETARRLSHLTPEERAADRTRRIRLHQANLLRRHQAVGRGLSELFLRLGDRNRGPAVIPRSGKDKSPLQA